MPVATLLLTTLLAAAPEAGENLYRAAKLGDWIEFKSSGSGIDEVIMRHTVVAKTDDSLTIKIDQTVAGKKGPPIEYKVNLKLPYPPPMPKVDDPDAPETKTEKLESGKETLTIAGMKYDCEWVKNKTTITPKKGDPTVIVTKSWICKDVPLGGSVRSETEVGKIKTVTELIGHGRGK